MTLEFEEQLQQKFSNLTNQDIVNLISDIAPYAKHDLKSPVTDSNIQIKEFADVVFKIVIFYREKRMLTFKQWKTLNGYLLKRRRVNEKPIIYKNFNTTK